MSDDSTLGWWDTLTGNIGKMIGGHIVQWALKLFLGLGIGFGSYTTIVQPLVDQAKAAWGHVPAQLTAMLGALGLDIAITMIFSAYLAKWGIKMLFRRTTPS